MFVNDQVPRAPTALPLSTKAAVIAFSNSCRMESRTKSSFRAAAVNKPQSRGGLRVGRRESVFLQRDSERICVVPHRPAYPVPLKCGANVLDPAQARGRRRVSAID